MLNMFKKVVRGMVRGVGHVRMEGFKQFEACNHPNKLKYWVGGLAHSNSRLKSQ